MNYNTRFVLNKFGIYSCYIGHHYLIDVITEIKLQDNNFNRINISNIYRKIATHHDTCVSNIEYNVRLMINRSINKYTQAWCKEFDLCYEYIFDMTTKDLIILLCSL